MFVVMLIFVCCTDKQNAEQHHEEIGLLEQQLMGVKSELRQREAQLEVTTFYLLVKEVVCFIIDGGGL